LTSHVVQRKRPCCTCPDVVSSQPLSPPDKSPKESPSTTYPKRPPSNFLITRGCPRDRSHGQSPSTNSVKRTPAQDSNPEPATDRVLASSRTRISSPPVIVGAQRPWCVPPECDLRHQRILPPPRVIFNKTSERKHSHTKSNREACPVQWDRTIRSLDPVRGITRRSIPPPFHWLEEKCPETSSQEPWMFFFFYILIQLLAVLLLLQPHIHFSSCSSLVCLTKRKEGVQIGLWCSQIFYCTQNISLVKNEGT
jgi:hypothetical protein